MLKMTFCRVELSLRRQQRSEVDVRLRRAGIQTYRLSELLRCFIGATGLLQLGSVVNMGPHARRKVRNNRSQTFQFASATLYFGIPESRERNHKNSDPFYA